MKKLSLLLLTLLAGCDMIGKEYIWTNPETATEFTFRVRFNAKHTAAVVQHRAKAKDKEIKIEVSHDYSQCQFFDDTNWSCSSLTDKIAVVDNTFIYTFREKTIPFRTEYFLKIPL